MTTPNPRVSDIINDEVKQPTAPSIVMQGNASTKLPDFSDPVAVQAYIAAITAENAALLAAEAKRKEELSYKARIEKEPRFIPARNNLLVRRIVNPEEIVSARDTFDFLDLTDKKREEKNTTRTYVSNLELETYQTMKSEGIKDITYKMIEDRLKKAGHTVVDISEAEIVPDVEAKE